MNVIKLMDHPEDVEKTPNVPIYRVHLHASVNQVTQEIPINNVSILMNVLNQTFVAKELFVQIY